ncbi:MAG: capsular polysaccharide synthesis protein [Acetobacteraceae bacterium]|nr:capsular polysaccharide synthesis protein [Acetobacteraceae bacterium]
MDEEGRIEGLGTARQRAAFDAEAAAILAALPPPPEAKRREVPRRTWLYWGQGWTEAPEVCRLCLESWRRWNPRHEIAALDAARAEALVGPPGFDLGPFPERVRSNLLRLRLLSRFGGVWADATLFCTAPLDAWLPLLTQRAGCFLFSLPEQEKPISTWFLAGDGASALIAGWGALYRAILERHAASGRDLPFYFVMHRSFLVLLRGRPEAAAEWARCQLVPAAGPLALGNLLDLEGRRGAPQGVPLAPQERDRAEALHARYPLHKLSWKKAMAEGSPRARSALDLCRGALASAPGG